MFASVNKTSGPLETAIKVSSSVGAVVGQCLFGLLSDLLGRKKVCHIKSCTDYQMYGAELIVMIAAIFSLSLTGGAPAPSITYVTIFWRVVLGIGIGGDYPTSSIITSELAPVRWRGAMMAAVFANQGLGQLTAALVSFICIARYKDFLRDSICEDDCKIALDQSWRILYGLGIVPAIVALYFRLTIPESVRYTLDVKGDEPSAQADTNRFLSGRLGSARLTRIVRDEADLAFPKASYSDFIKYFGKWGTGKKPLGAGISWALLDVSFV